jgi:outer membrane protein assembly factor BamB
MHLPVLTAALAFTLTVPAFALDWPQWRGPARDAHQTETGLLQQWPAGGPKRLWMFEKAGMGYSGFAVAGGKLFTMGVRDGQEVLYALDAATGKELWATPMGALYEKGGEKPDYNVNWGEGPRSTPTVDGDRVYALGAWGNLVCASTKDGKKLWSRTMQDLGGSTFGWGYSESPTVDGAKVVCTPGGPQGTIAALDKMTGKTIWQSKELTDQAQYASLVPATIHGVPQYVQRTMQALVGVAAKDGKVVWRSPWEGRTAMIPTPIVKGNFVFGTGGYGIGCKMVEVKADGTASEVYRHGNMENHHGGVILIGDYIYGHSKQGWTCLDFKTGEPKWVENQKLKKGAIAYAGGRLYLLDEKTGQVVLIEPSPEAWKEHGRFTLEPQSKVRNPKGAIWTHPVIANGRLYLRDQDLIYCYAVK